MHLCQCLFPFETRKATHADLLVLIALRQASITSLLVIRLLLPRHRRPRTPRHKRPNPQNDPQHPTNHHKLEKRTTPTTVIQIIQRPLHAPPRPVPRAIQILVPHLMPMLIEMRYVVVNALRETTGSRSRSCRMVVRPIWTARRVLRALLALRAVASRAVERGRWAFELCASLAET